MQLLYCGQKEVREDKRGVGKDIDTAEAGCGKRRVGEWKCGGEWIEEEEG